MDQTYMKEKPVVPLLLSMGIPVIISMIAGALYNIVDSIFVAMISEDAMTAVSLVYPIQNLAHAAGVGFGVGINAMVARRLGEGKTRMANQTASQGVFLSALHGMILTILGMAVIPYFLRMFTSDEVTISYGLTYFCNVFLFSTIDTMGMAYEKVYQSVGKMKISMAAVLIGCVVNIVLDPIFIFGLGPMPELVPAKYHLNLKNFSNSSEKSHLKHRNNFHSGSDSRKMANALNVVFILARGLMTRVRRFR